MAFDFKKEYKDLYLPGKKPAIIDVPEMAFFTVEGKGDPNTSSAYKNAMEILYGLSYTVKMSKMTGDTPAGYFDYVVPPLEGLWWRENGDADVFEAADKESFCWISMIRQPDFVNEEVFLWAKEQLLKKKPGLDFSRTRFLRWKEGLCAQIMHIGSYDDESISVAVLHNYMEEQGVVSDKSRRHHEIYLGDPRKTAPERLKTVIRLPIQK